MAAETEGAAAEGVAKLKVEYEMLASFTDDHDLAAAEARKRTQPGGGKVSPWMRAWASLGR